MSSQIDHLVVVASTLEQGATWCEATLGVAPGPGGRHALMGTHNRLLAISSAGFPSCYLELIAVDPEAPPPQRARWFEMDNPSQAAAVREQPRLMHAVARTTMIEMLRWGLINCGPDPGPLIAAQRDTAQGRLSWRITVPDDGALRCAGALPTLIEWQGVHPCEHLAPSPVSLQRLSLRGLTPQVRDVLRLQGVDSARKAGPALRVELNTPRGVVELESWQ